MLLNNSDNDLPEDCRKLDTRTFVLYAKAQLNREQERFIDNHCGRCDNCRANLAYVYEIVKGNERLSTDGQTLLLKYLHDPIYKNAIEKLKDSIREEILDEIRFLLVDIVKDNKVFSLTNAKDCPSITDNNPTNNQNSLDKATSQTTSQSSKPFNKIINKIPNIKANYSYFVSAFLVVVFVSLSIFTYLAINNPNRQSNNTNNPSNNSSSLNPIFSTITQLRPNDQLSNNLYQQLDTAIDEYLESKNTGDLTKAKVIAKDIEQKYGDKYGVDLVSYYQSIPSSVREKLLSTRKRLAEMFDKSSGDNYQQRLTDSQNLEKDFLAFGNLIEAYKTKILVNKLLLHLDKDQEANSFVQEGLKFSINNKYIFLQAHFLLWKAKGFSKNSDFVNTEESLLQVIELGNKLDLYKIVNSAGISLTTLYYNNDENEKAFNLSKKLLVNFSDYKNTQAISFLQIAGLAAFNLHYNNIAIFYLQEAINNSQLLNIPTFTVRSYSFLGLVLSEEKKFYEANNYYSLAEKELNKINENAAKQESISIIVGYKAKTKLLEGDYSQALELYKYRLFLMKTLHINNTLEISQINEALAIVLTQLGQNEKAQVHSTIAKNYKNLANANKETANCLLSLAPSNCSSR